MKALPTLGLILVLAGCATHEGARIIANAPAASATSPKDWQAILSRWMDFAEAKGGALTRRDAVSLLRLMAEHRLVGHKVPMDDKCLMGALDAEGENALALRLYTQFRKEWLAEFDENDVVFNRREIHWQEVMTQESLLRTLAYWDGRMDPSSPFHTDIQTRIPSVEEWVATPLEPLPLRLLLCHASGAMDTHDLDAAARCAMRMKLKGREAPDPGALVQRLTQAGRHPEAASLRAKWAEWYPDWEMDTHTAHRFRGGPHFTPDIQERLRKSDGHGDTASTPTINQKELRTRLLRRDWSAYWALSSHHAFTDHTAYGTGDRCMRPDDEEIARWALMLEYMTPAEALSFLGNPVLTDYPGEGSLPWNTLLSWGKSQDHGFPQAVIRQWPQWSEPVNAWRFAEIKWRMGWDEIPQGHRLTLPWGMQQAEE